MGRGEAAALALGALAIGGLALTLLREGPQEAGALPTTARGARAPLEKPTRSASQARGSSSETPAPRRQPASVSKADQATGPSPAKNPADRILAILAEAVSDSSAARLDEVLLARLRALGPGVLVAGLSALERPDARVLVARALAGLPEAGGLIESVLGELDDDNALAALAAAMPEGAESRDHIGRAFLTQGRADGRRVLLRALADRDDVDRALIAAAGLKDADPGIRGESIALLARVADPRDREALMQLARRDPDVGVRARALIALGAIGGPEAGAAIVEAAFDRGLVPSLRASAAVALGRLGDASARAALGRMTEEDPDSLVRRRAAAILALLEQGERR